MWSARAIRSLFQPKASNILVFQSRDMLRPIALAPILRDGITKEIKSFGHEKKTPRLRPARFGRPNTQES